MWQRPKDNYESLIENVDERAEEHRSREKVNYSKRKLFNISIRSQLLCERQTDK